MPANRLPLCEAPAGATIIGFKLRIIGEAGGAAAGHCGCVAEVGVKLAVTPPPRRRRRGSSRVAGVATRSPRRSCRPVTRPQATKRSRCHRRTRSRPRCCDGDSAIFDRKRETYGCLQLLGWFFGLNFSGHHPHHPMAGLGRWLRASVENSKKLCFFCQED